MRCEQRWAKPIVARTCPPQRERSRKRGTSDVIHPTNLGESPRGEANRSQERGTSEGVDWRRGRDSNPRYGLTSVQRISNPPLSTTQPPLPTHRKLDICTFCGPIHLVSATCTRRVCYILLVLPPTEIHGSKCRRQRHQTKRGRQYLSTL